MFCLTGWLPEQFRTDEEGFDWRYDSVAEAFGPNGTEFLAQFAGTDYAVYNRGLWGRLPTDKAEVVMGALYDLTGGKEKREGRCFYRSTTSCERTTKNDLGSWEHDKVRPVAYAEKCEYLDYNHVTEAFGHFVFRVPKPDRNLAFERSSVFWDAVHYQPWVYEELNNLLLNVLCNADQGDRQRAFSAARRPVGRDQDVPGPRVPFRSAKSSEDGKQGKSAKRGKNAK